MITNQLPYDGGGGEIVAESTPKELVIPTQRGTPDRRVAPLKGDELKPILAPWLKDRAKFTYKMHDVRSEPRIPSGGIFGMPCLRWPSSG